MRIFLFIVQLCKMFNNYNACLMNESYVFHTSTSTFRNPIFDTQIVDDDEDNDNNYASNNNNNNENSNCSQDNEREGQRGATDENQETPLAPHRLVKDKANEMGGISMSSDNRTSSTSKDDANSQTICSNNTSCSSSQSDLSQRWQDFCDNLAFSIKGKLFIMEFNFKRRLRAMRKYLDKKVPWMLPLNHQHYNATRPTNKQACNCSMFNNKSNTGSSSCCRGSSSSSSSSSNNNNKTKNKSNDSHDIDQRKTIGFGGFQFPEPKSAKTLGAQQECLLNRLEQIKRDSQKLTNMQRTIQQQQQQEEEEDDDDDDDDDDGTNGGDINYIDYDDSNDIDETGSHDNYNVAHSSDQIKTNKHQAIANHLSRPHSSYVLRPELGEANAISSSQAAPAASANSSGTKFEQSSDDNAIATGKAATKQSARRVGSKPSRGQWILRGGKNIKDTALAFTSSKKSCIVCYERPPNIVTLPCKHSDICSDCFIEIIFLAVKHSQYPLRCVLCRQKIERIRCSRRLLLTVIEKKRFKRCF